MLFLTNSFLSTNAWFLVFTAHLFLPLLGPSYTIFFFVLCYIKALLPHDHFGGKCREVGAPGLPAAQGCASSQRNMLWLSLLLKPRHSTNTLLKTRSESVQVFSRGMWGTQGHFSEAAQFHPHPLFTAPAGTTGSDALTPTALRPFEHSSLEKGWELQTKGFERWNGRC